MSDLPNDLSLPSVVAAIEEIEEEKRQLGARIAAIKKQACGPGRLDKTALNEILRERKMPPARRRILKQSLELYRAALGMLDGTPLGEHARAAAAKGAPLGEAEDTGDETLAETTAADLDQARAAGEASAKAGQAILENPFVAGDPRRAAWDEGWCRASGSDGMDIPAYLRRAPKKPDNKGGKPPEGGAGAPAAGGGDGEEGGAP